MKGRRISIGAGDQSFPGWIPTQKEELDLLNRKSFEVFFGESKAKAFICEHVWEHLTEDQGRAAAKICYDFLDDNGVMRVAVPDGNFPNEDYQKLVQVGGPGPADHPAADHKIVYTLPTLVSVFESAGFLIEPLEFCDTEGQFHHRDWDWQSGPICRSLRSDTRNQGTTLGFVSLILELRKQPS